MTKQPIILLKTIRDGIDDECYFGSYYLAKNDKITVEKGLDKDNIFFMRSLAKPLQASIMCDCNIINEYGISQKELAIFCASHSGSPKHIELLKSILKKYHIKTGDMEIAPLEPLDKKYYNNYKTKLHNNCSGKHIMMILMSKYKNFDIKNYTNPNHPIQKLIYKKQTELSEYKSSYLTYDGCSTPLWGLPAKNIIKAYYNFFNNKNNQPLIQSVLKNHYIFGGDNRLDSEIIKLSKSKLFSKVGAGGFVIVYNIKLNEILLLKMTQNNNKVRRLIVLDMLNKLKWLKTDKIPQYVLNQKNQKVAKYCYQFDI